MVFRSAGEKMGAIDAPMQPKEYYPCLTIDLEKFPELEKDIGEECELLIKICAVSKNMSESHSSQTFEVREIGVPKKEKPKNRADAALDDLGSARRY